MKRTLQDLDPIERRLLALVQQDASLSHNEMAERVGASSASVWRRIKALETEGFLGRTVRLVDANRIGRGVNVLCHIRMSSHAKEPREAFERWIQTQPEVLECYSMTGDFDYLLRVVVADVADYNAYLMRQLLGHPSVSGGSSHFALDLVKHTTAMPV